MSWKCRVFVVGKLPVSMGHLQKKVDHENRQINKRT